MTSADQLGMVEEEVTTEIIKSEIQVGTVVNIASVRGINIFIIRLMTTAATFKLRTRV